MITPRTRPSIISAPGAAQLVSSSLLARLPLAMFGIALIVHAQRLTGSFAVAGVVSGAYAIAGALSSPVLGRLVDRCGQTRVLLSGSAASSLLLLATAVLPASAPPALLVALAAALGLATPPIAACVRTLLPTVLADPCALRAAYAFDATAVELTFIFGPPLALVLGAVWSTGAALGVSGMMLLVSTIVFVAQPASRRWRPSAHGRRPHGGSLHAPAIRALVLVFVAVGAVFGAVDVGVAAAARHLGGSAVAGPLLGLWGLGSLLGGVAATRLGGGAAGARGLTLLLTGLALGHGALLATTASVWAMGAVLVLAGASIAPTCAGIYAMVQRAAPAGTHTEAFAWLATASSTGGSAGAVVAGALVQHAGAPAAFAAAGVAGLIAVLIAAVGSATVNEAGAPPRVTIELATARVRLKPPAHRRPT